MKNRDLGTARCIVCGIEFPQRSAKHKICSEECKVQRKLLAKEGIDHSRYYIYERDGFRCAYCGRSPIEDGICLAIEHITPRSFGGSNSIFNVITSCQGCNIHKACKQLSASVHRRLIAELEKRNKGISTLTREMIERDFREHYGENLS